MHATTDAADLARLISTHAPYDGEFRLRHPGVYAIKMSRPTPEAAHGLQQPAACIVASGAKKVMIGQGVYEYQGGDVAVYAVDLPLTWQITRATESEPYLTLKINLKPERIIELAATVFPHGVPQDKQTASVYVAPADVHVIDAATRLMELMSRPADAELIAPLVIDEILIRLLRGPMGSRIAQLGQAESTLHRIAMAVAWLRENFDQIANVDELARLVNMSSSNFHRQFKAVTSMSPLQFQKALRLQEARRLMVTTNLEAGAAGRRVGYASASQFTREYARCFGTSPTKDVQRLRANGLAATATSSA